MASSSDSMDNTFRARVQKIFGSLSSSSSSLSPPWSLTDCEVEKREWRRPSSAKDDDQTPISFFFDGLACRVVGFRHERRLSVKRGAPSEKAGKKPAAKKGKAAKDPNKPKRPASAFFRYIEDDKNAFYFRISRRMEFMTFGIGLMIGPSNCDPSGGFHIAKLLYPLGHVIGGTVYPGLTLTAGTMWWILNSLNIPLSVETVCVFTAPVFSAIAIWATYLLTKEVKGAGAGLTAAVLLAMIRMIHGLGGRGRARVLGVEVRNRWLHLRIPWTTLSELESRRYSVYLYWAMAHPIRETISGIGDMPLPRH
ncbi:hypothetical protein TEA_006769 [Camellia sinensis var. sinensis]|uniref:dolichyl-diphosphooligosaccharide--protein glycotransferase n=1 Tax=Camellia sinensis var. sinensis TaxID=542762 RepID=A0A4V3WJN7_CAMSN|nr:hypothetical protein TEA_006769 [Camellia sinensis var. sinensis]